MMAIVSLNILLLSFGLILIILAFSKHNKNLFSDITNVYNLAIIIIPLTLIIFNLIFTTTKYPELTLISFYPLTLPFIYFTRNYFDKYFSKKKYEKLKRIKKQILRYASESKAEILENDIRIRLLPKNKVDIIINYYSEEQEEIIKKIIHRTEESLLANKEYKNVEFNFYRDQKKRLNLLIN